MIVFSHQNSLLSTTKFHFMLYRFVVKTLSALCNFCPLRYPNCLLCLLEEGSSDGEEERGDACDHKPPWGSAKICCGEDCSVYSANTALLKALLLQICLSLFSNTAPSAPAGFKCCPECCKGGKPLIYSVATFFGCLFEKRIIQQTVGECIHVK